jgi:hypothetical protein
MSHIYDLREPLIVVLQFLRGFRALIADHTFFSISNLTVC